MTDSDGSIKRELDKKKQGVERPVYAPFKPPFKYDPMGVCIFDSAGNMIVDVRGWGFLTGKGAMAYDQGKAIKIQDRIGKRIAQIMTEDAGL